MAADLIIYGIIAAALVFWLRSILGTRTGAERERPNPFSPRNDNRAGEDADQTARRPTLDIEAELLNDEKPAPETLPPVRITKTTLVGRSKIETPNAELGLRQIAAADGTFNLDRFLEGAEMAFEMVVTAFAKGDIKTLRALLTPSVFNDFEAALTDRATRGETVETKIEAVNGMDILSAQLRGRMAYISVRFTVQETCLIRNAAGALIAGEPDKTTKMIDLWTFGRDITSNSPTWFLHETRDEQAEDHKTPLPESK